MDVGSLKELRDVNGKIGTPSDASTAATLFGRLQKSVNDLKTRIDTLEKNMGGSGSGEQLYYLPSDNVRHTLISGVKTFEYSATTPNNQSIYVNRWIAKHSGIVKVLVSGKVDVAPATPSPGKYMALALARYRVYTKYGGGSYTATGYTPFIMGAYPWFMATPPPQMSRVIYRFYSSSSSRDTGGDLISISQDTYTSYERYTWVEAGDVLAWGVDFDNAEKGTQISINKLQICYDEVG